MNDKQKIPQFWDKGIMLVDGCTKVSPGCKNCWSEAMTARFNRVPDVLTDGRFNGKVIFNLHLLEKAAKVKKPQVYAIWNDLYHDGITDAQIYKAHYAISEGPQHTWLTVTKRPLRASEYFKSVGDKWGINVELNDNIWHIVTTENQAMADKRIPHLLRIPGKRGIIIEPMLEAVDLKLENEKHWECPECGDFVLTEAMSKRLCLCGKGGYSLANDTHQVILGPENGPGKRPFDPAWAESVKAQCEAAGVPFYRKDTGEGVLAWRKESE